MVQAHTLSLQSRLQLIHGEPRRCNGLPRHQRCGRPGCLSRKRTYRNHARHIPGPAVRRDHPSRCEQVVNGLAVQAAPRNLIPVAGLFKVARKADGRITAPLAVRLREGAGALDAPCFAGLRHGGQRSDLKLPPILRFYLFQQRGPAIQQEGRYLLVCQAEGKGLAFPLAPTMQIGSDGHPAALLKRLFFSEVSVTWAKKVK